MPPAEAQPDLFQQAEEAADDPHPLALLALASSLLATLERDQHPFDRQRPEPPPLAGLLETFAVSGLPAMANLAAVMAQLQADELLRTRLLRQLDRTALLPWVTALDQVAPSRAGRIVEGLRDGTNLVIEFAVHGQPLCAVTFVDHNQGSAAKDGFLIPESLDGFLDVWRHAGGPDDTEFEELSVAEIAAAVTEAVDMGAITWPPYESESWPQARPLVRWLIRQSPAGAASPARPEWDDDARDRLVEEFLASHEGTPWATDPDARLLVDTLVWYGTDYTYGDPRLFSPVNVEILLSDWMSRKLMADTSTLAKLPSVLGAYVRFTHGQAGVAERSTRETLAAIQTYTPGYRSLIGKPRHAKMVDLAAMRVAELAETVGGPEQLARLDTEPLPAEELDLTDVPADVLDRVRRIGALGDGCCEMLFNLETRTAVRRLLHDVAVGDPMIFRRRSRDETAAAALCWLVANANGDLSNTGRVQSQDLMAHFGLTGSPSQRATSMRAAIGLAYHAKGLGSPRYLSSAHRNWLILMRDGG